MGHGFTANKLVNMSNQFNGKLKILAGLWFCNCIHLNIYCFLGRDEMILNVVIMNFVHVWKPNRSQVHVIGVILQSYMVRSQEYFASLKNIFHICFEMESILLSSNHMQKTFSTINNWFNFKPKVQYEE